MDSRSYLHNGRSLHLDELSQLIIKALQNLLVIYTLIPEEGVPQRSLEARMQEIKMLCCRTFLPEEFMYVSEEVRWEAMQEVLECAGR